MVPTEPRSIVEIALQRRRVLDSLTQENKPKADLVDELEIPRSTLDRSVRDLERVGLVERGNGGCKSTVFGELVFSRIQRFLKSTEKIAEAEPILSSIKTLEDELGQVIPIGNDAEVVLSSTTIPERPAEVLTKISSGTGSLQVLMPADSSAYRQLLFESSNSETKSTYIIANSAMSHLISSNYKRKFRDLVTRTHTSIHLMEDVPCGLILSEETNSGGRKAVIVGHDESGMQGIVVCTDDLVWKRLEDAYELLLTSTRASEDYTSEM